MVSPTKKRPATKNIAFSGAGGLGFALLGMMQALEDAGELDELENVSGTSAGAIMALVAGLGYRGEDFEKVAMQQNFENFTDLDWREALRIPKNILRGGVFSGKELEGYCEYITAKRTGMPSMTFEQLNEHINAAKKTIWYISERLASNPYRILRTFLLISPPLNK